MQLLPRKIASEILQMAKFYPVITVVGPRQSGKTTLVKQIFHDKKYVSLENLDQRELAESDPRSFLARFKEGAIIDEIQRVPSLLSYIQEIVDNSDEKAIFILTGSNQFALQQNVSQSLAGRTAILKLLPLSQAELQDSGYKLSLDEQLLYGMYPRIYKDNIPPTKFYRDYVATYVERDVRQMINVKDLHQFQIFLKLCASRVGQIFNAQNLANEVGISHSTVNNWLSILEAAFLLFRIYPYYENFGKRVIKRPKIYFNDVGLVAYLLQIENSDQLSRDPLRGNLFENFIMSEIVKNYLNKGEELNLYFYRDSNNNEIDCILKQGNDLVPIEIKSSRTYNKAFLKNLNQFQAISNNRVKTGFLIYSGEIEQGIGDFKLYNYKNIDNIFP